MRRVMGFLFSVPVIALLSGCATPPDYTAFRARQPRSVVVIPPLNESTDLKATYGVLSTVTRPLAEMGYYVFPVAVVDNFFRENGMPTPGEMNLVPLRKIDEIIGADAVLYLVVNQYGTKYAILDSSTVVRMSARLVDVKTGGLLWQGHVNLVQSSSSGSQGLVGMLVSAAINQVVSHSTDEAHKLAFTASSNLFTTRNKGLLYGPYRPEFGTD